MSPRLNVVAKSSSSCRHWSVTLSIVDLLSGIGAWNEAVLKKSCIMGNCGSRGLRWGRQAEIAAAAVAAQRQ